MVNNSKLLNNIKGGNRNEEGSKISSGVVGNGYVGWCYSSTSNQF
jgi:hypothetical protein